MLTHLLKSFYVSYANVKLLTSVIIACSIGLSSTALSEPQSGQDDDNTIEESNSFFKSLLEFNFQGDHLATLLNDYSDQAYDKCISEGELPDNCVAYVGCLLKDLLENNKYLSDLPDCSDNKEDGTPELFSFDLDGNPIIHDSQYERRSIWDSQTPRAIPPSFFSPPFEPDDRYNRLDISPFNSPGEFFDPTIINGCFRQDHFIPDHITNELPECLANAFLDELKKS